MRMKKIYMLMLPVAFALPVLASAGDLNFDDLSGSGDVGTYHGFQFDGWNYYDYDQPPYTPHSAPERIYDLDNNNSITNTTPFVFNGAWFAGYDYGDVTFDLYLGGNLVATSGTLSPSATPAFLASGYAGLVDEVVVESPNPDYFVMDDFTYDQSPTGVPEPGTLALLGFCLAGLGLGRWQKARLISRL